VFLFFSVVIVASEFCKHVRDRAGVMESIAGVSGRSVLDHFEFTDVRFGMRVPDTASLLYSNFGRVMVFFLKKNILIPNVAEKNILILVEEKKSDSEFLSYNLMLNSGKKLIF
jgi:hypothetical protein